MSTTDTSKPLADFQATRDELLALHQRMVIDRDMDPMEFYQALVNYAAWAGTSLMPLGKERRAVKVMSEAFAKQIREWLADPDVKASRVAALAGPAGMH